MRTMFGALIAIPIGLMVLISPTARADDGGHEGNEPRPRHGWHQPNRPAPDWFADRGRDRQAHDRDGRAHGGHERWGHDHSGRAEHRRPRRGDERWRGHHQHGHGDDGGLAALLLNLGAMAIINGVLSSPPSNGGGW